MRLFVLLSMIGLLSFPASAQTPAEEQAGAELSYDDFGVPEQTLKVIEPAAQENAEETKAFPDCNDNLLVLEVRRVLAADTEGIKEESIVERRARLLALKNTENFRSIEVSSFRPEDNYELANILISAKINEGQTNESFRICVSDNPTLKRRIFLLLQEQSDDVKVYIVNYRPGKVTSFIFKK